MQFQFKSWALFDTRTYPTFNRSAMVWAKLISLHQTEAESPYNVALAPSIASFIVLNGINLTLENAKCYVNQDELDNACIVEMRFLTKVT